MAVVSRIMAAGLAPLAAVNIVGDFTGSLAALGSSQGTALLLSSAVNNVTTTTASTGVQLPGNVAVGDCIEVSNQGASTLSVYGQTGDAIQGGSANAAFSVATNKSAIFRRVSSTAWTAILSA